MKDEFMKWARPLWLFVSGMVILALNTVLYPEIGNILGATTSQVAAEGIDLNRHCFQLQGRCWPIPPMLPLCVPSSAWSLSMTEEPVLSRTLLRPSLRAVQLRWRPPARDQ
jgi:hypothetical protein